jgi:DHA1 family multidrug resistance protein-like MFS transporter
MDFSNVIGSRVDRTDRVSPLQPHPLPRALRRRGLIVLLANTFLMWAGFFMIVPILSIHFVDQLGWEAAAIGVVLGTRQLVQQTLTVAGGALADRFGAKGLIIVGLLIRVFAFTAMAWAIDFPVLLILGILAAIGGSMFDSPSAAAIAALTTDEERLQFYSLRGVMTGLGLALGPLIGSALLAVDFALVAYLSGAVFALSLIITWLFLPPVKIGSSEQTLTHGLQLALRDRPFVILIALLMGYWFLWVQLTLSVPLKAEALTGEEGSVGAVYLVNSLITIFLQMPLMRWLEPRVRPMPATVIGLGLMALGLGSIAVAGSIVALLVCIGVFSIGNLIALANQNLVIANLAHPDARGSYFGVSSIALAFGGSLGNFVGSALYGASVEHETPMLPWLVIGAIGLLAAIGLWMLDRYQRRRPGRFSPS